MEFDTKYPVLYCLCGQGGEVKRSNAYVKQLKSYLPENGIPRNLFLNLFKVGSVITEMTASNMKTTSNMKMTKNMELTSNRKTTSNLKMASNMKTTANMKTTSNVKMTQNMKITSNMNGHRDMILNLNFIKVLVQERRCKPLGIGLLADIVNI